MAFLYGSQARGFPKEASDVDIALVFKDKSCSEDKLFDLITNISFSLSREIPLEINFIAITNIFRHPMLYYNAVVLEIPVFIKDFDQYIAIKNEVLMQMEDFGIFGTGWQLVIARKNLEDVHHA